MRPRRSPAVAATADCEADVAGPEPTPIGWRTRSSNPQIPEVPDLVPQPPGLRLIACLRPVGGTVLEIGGCFRQPAKIRAPAHLHHRLAAIDGVIGADEKLAALHQLGRAHVRRAGGQDEAIGVSCPGAWNGTEQIDTD